MYTPKLYTLPIHTTIAIQMNEYYLIHCSYEDFQVRGRETTIVVNSTEFRLGVTTGLFTR